MALPLTAIKSLVFRITHVENLQWILENGLCCRSSGRFDPAYKNIGNIELIDRRSRKEVPIHPGGTLSDYVPFYFTSRSPMLLNIKSGRNVMQLPMRDIIIFVTSLRLLSEAGVPFVFTDRHAYLVNARFLSELDDLDSIDWTILQNSDFAADPDDPGKMERYQAEALVYQRLDFEHVRAILVHDEQRQVEIAELVRQAGYATSVKVERRYFF